MTQEILGGDFAGGNGLAMINGNFRAVLSIAALKELPTTNLSTASTRTVLGYLAEGDGGGGLFRWDPLASAADNGGTIIAPNSRSGRWLRVSVQDQAINVQHFGAVLTATATQTRQGFEQALAYAASIGKGAIYVPSRSTAYTFDAPITVNNIAIIGESLRGCTLNFPAGSVAAAGHAITLQGGGGSHRPSAPEKPAR